MKFLLFCTSIHSLFCWDWPLDSAGSTHSLQRNSRPAGGKGWVLPCPYAPNGIGIFTIFQNLIPPSVVVKTVTWGGFPTNQYIYIYFYSIVVFEDVRRQGMVDFSNHWLLFFFCLALLGTITYPRSEPASTWIDDVPFAVWWDLLASWMVSCQAINFKSHLLHGTGIFTYIYHKFQPN